MRTTVKQLEERIQKLEANLEAIIDARVNVLRENWYAALQKQREEQIKKRQAEQGKKECHGCERKRREAAMMAGPALDIPKNPRGVPYPVEVPTIGEVVEGHETQKGE